MKQTRRKPGPKPVTPTSTDCRKVELGIAGGLSAASLARLFAMPVTTFKRAYAEQISTGRTRVLLDTLVALDREASAGSRWRLQDLPTMASVLFGRGSVTCIAMAARKSLIMLKLSIRTQSISILVYTCGASVL